MWLGLFGLTQALLVLLACRADGQGRTLLAFALLYVAGTALLWPLCRSFRLEGRRGFALVVGLGVLFRAAWLLAPPDADVFRYAWEGLVQLAGHNPYALAPDSPVLEGLAAAHPAVFGGMFFRQFTAIYPPLLELFFRLAAWVLPGTLGVKLLLLPVEAGVLAVLAALLARRGIRPGRLLLWALNPLALLFLAGDGHAEAVQLLPLLLGLLFFERGQAGRGFFCLGLAAMAKYFAFLAVPFCLRADNRRKAWWALAPLLLFLPFADAGAGLFRMLATFGGWHSGGLAAELLWPVSGGATPLLLGAGLLACLVAVFLAVQERLRSVALAFACLLLLLPTVHPWYLCMVAVFLPLFPSRAWLWLCGAMAVRLPVNWTPATGGLVGDWAWLTVAEYGGFLALLAWGVWRDDRMERERRWTRPASVSVVVPVLDEAARLPACLAAVAAAGGAAEVVVADGGSTDGTAALAERLGARVVRSAPGRGTQIAAGARAARGDVVVVLHADCLPDPGLFARMREALTRRPEAPGGAAAMRYAGPEGGGAGTGLVALANNWRARLSSIAFGDQAQFVRADALKAMGGFPELPLMEDVELSLRLKEAGPFLFLGRGISGRKPGVAASARRWRREGLRGNAAAVVLLLGRWLAERRLGLPRSPDHYYRRYYGLAADGKKAITPRQP
ncbi:glycosyl transferase family 2 [Desulfovibrio sp. X2]|nr:glycosyl transferase family 2 [Desulfovibrio sp. X2]